MDWRPIRKIIAVAISAAASAGSVIAWFAGSGDLDWKEVVGAVVVAVVPVVIGYLTPPDTKQGEQAVSAGTVSSAALTNALKSRTPY